MLEQHVRDVMPARGGPHVEVRAGAAFELLIALSASGGDDGSGELWLHLLGLALELRLRRKVTIGMIERRHQSRNVDTDRMLFTPGRPGALLSEARERGLG